MQFIGAVSHEILYQKAVLLWRTTLGLTGCKPHKCWIKNKGRSLHTAGVASSKLALPTKSRNDARLRRFSSSDHGSDQTGEPKCFIPTENH